MHLPNRLSLIFVTLILMFASLSVSAQEPFVAAPHRPVAPKLPYTGKWHKPAVLRSMVGGFWMIDENFRSSIYIKNELVTSSITVTPILYLSNGGRYTLPAVKLQPSGNATVSINDALRDQNIAPWATLTGYVEIQYEWPWDAICATVHNIDAVHSLIFNYGLQRAMLASGQVTSPILGDRHNIEGMWWKQEANVIGFVALSNVTGQSINARIEVTDERGTLRSVHPVAVSPHGTKVLNIVDSQWIAGSAGGWRLTFDGPDDGLLVNGGLEDKGTGYSANLVYMPALTPSAKLLTRNYAELGLMVGAADPMMSFPANTTFIPYSVVRNISDEAVSVTPTIWWMQGAVARSARLQRFSVLPHQTNSMDVMSLLSQAGLSHFNGSVNLVLNVQGKFHALLIAAGSVDQKSTYVFEVGPQGILESAAKSLSYWSTGNGDDTMVTLWNPADEPQNLTFTLSFSGGHYALPIHLAARATQAFNISELIHNQIPDAEGNIIPANVQEGNAQISGTGGENEAILVAMDAGTYNVRKATCGQWCRTCQGVVDAWTALTPFGLPVAQHNQQTLTVQYHTGTQGNDTSNGGWSSTHTNIATVGYSTGLVTGVAPGSTPVVAWDGMIADYSSGCEGYQFDCPLNTGAGGSSDGTVCPNSTSTNHLDQYGVELLFPNIETGIGGLATMGVSPATPNNTAITESLITSSNSCPNTWGNLCSGASTFYVGQGGQGSVNGMLFGPVYPGVANTFYDQHTITSTSSLLDYSNINTCTAVCTQTYSCSGVPINNHTITYTFIKALINGTHVTSTQVSKQ